jgi:hypothetical protein
MIVDMLAAVVVKMVTLLVLLPAGMTGGRSSEHTKIVFNEHSGNSPPTVQRHHCPFSM